MKNRDIVILRKIMDRHGKTIQHDLPELKAVVNRILKGDRD
jgi:hypothetical protein